MYSVDLLELVHPSDQARGSDPRAQDKKARRLIRGQALPGMGISSTISIELSCIMKWGWPLSYRSKLSVSWCERPSL
jgi:hypothetical protein